MTDDSRFTSVYVARPGDLWDKHRKYDFGIVVRFLGRTPGFKYPQFEVWVRIQTKYVEHLSQIFVNTHQDVGNVRSRKQVNFEKTQIYSIGHRDVHSVCTQARCVQR